MNIDTFNIYQYSLELNRPIMVNGNKLHRRNGLIIELKNANGEEGFGDVAPLPGFSQETLETVLGQVKILKSRLNGQTIPNELAKFDGQWERWLEPFQLAPSVRFGFESAVLQLMANIQTVPLYKLLPDAIHHKIPVTGLLSGTQDEVAKDAKNLIDQGYSDLKLKVGNNVREDVAKVKAVNKAAYGKAILHIDANQAWEFKQAIEFGKEVECTEVSYIEEPFKDLEKIPAFFDETMIPIALDESLSTIPLDKIQTISGVETLILKPTILGGIEKTLQLMTQAESSALNVVISSSFESSLGIATLAHIADNSTHYTSAGIDTTKWFKSDVLRQPLSIERGTMDLDHSVFTSKDVNFDLLEKVK